MRKRFKWLLALLGVFSLTACGVKKADIEEAIPENVVEEEIQNESQAESEPTELTGELTILSYTHWNMWASIIHEFMEEHPGVTITVDQPSEEEEQTADFYKKYMVRIMNGEGIDIVMTDFVSMEKYGADMGLFVDLYEYMDNDEGFDREDYFSCIFKPAETDGKLFRLIRSVQPVYIRLNKELLRQAGMEYTGEKISFEELYQIYSQVCERVEGNIYLADYGSYDPLGRYENGYFIRHNMFDSDEYKEYLCMNHELYYTLEARPEWTEYGQGIEEDVLCRVIAGLPLQENASVVNGLFEETEDMTMMLFFAQ